LDTPGHATEKKAVVVLRDCHETNAKVGSAVVTGFEGITKENARKP